MSALTNGLTERFRDQHRHSPSNTWSGGRPDTISRQWVRRTRRARVCATTADSPCDGRSRSGVLHHYLATTTGELLHTNVTAVVLGGVFRPLSRLTRHVCVQKVRPK